MQAKKNPPPKAAPPAQPEAVPPVPRAYDCTGCRYADAHGLICDVCLRQILDGQNERRKAFLLAACFEGRGCVTLLRGRAAYV